jgi:hypothetical protein
LRNWWETPDWAKEQRFFFPDPDKRHPVRHVYRDEDGEKVYVFVGGKALECRPSA